MGFERTSGYQPQVNATLEAFKGMSAETSKELTAERATASEAVQKKHEEMGAEMKQLHKQKDKKEILSKVKVNIVNKTEKQEKGQDLINKKAEAFQKKNPELNAKTLTLLRQQIGEKASKDDILRKVADFYSDPYLADEALEFLESTMEAEPELLKACQEARAEFKDNNDKDITIGRNIGELARQTDGLGPATSLRAFYKDITGNPRDANTLFDELALMYSYKDLQKVIKFLFHALGTDMKSKGPSIPRGQLHRLLSETRTLQAILGVYRYFKGRIPLTEKLFAKNGMKLPAKVTFELMSKQFMKMVAERYPSSDKILKLTDKFGVESSIIGKIIILSQIRDAVNEVSVNQIYKSIQHRDEIKSSIIEALDDLEASYEDYAPEDEHMEDHWEDDNNKPNNSK